MNYLTELLAFYKWMADTPLTPRLQAFWHLLMYTNNKAALRGEDGLWYWPVAFKLPNTVAMPVLDIRDRRVLLRQRGYLVDRGRVTYEKDKGQRAGKYRLIPFDKGLGMAELPGETGDSVTQIWTQISPQNGTSLSPFLNINTKKTSLLCSNQESAPSATGFKFLPQLTDDEKAAIRAKYPEDKPAAFEAEWRARELKR